MPVNSNQVYATESSYGVEPGNDWAGIYLVMDLDEFVSKMLDDSTQPSISQRAGNVPLHETTVMKTEQKRVQVPILEKYWQHNLILEGREHFYNHTKHKKDELNRLCYLMKMECSRLMRVENSFASPEELQ